MGALASPPQAWMPEKHPCAAPYLTKTRGGGRLLWWPPREPAHLGCSAATGHLCCQAGPSVAVTCNWLSPPCRMLSSRHYVSSCSPCGQDQKVAMRVCFAPSPGCHKRDLPPPNQLCDVDTTYELQTWVRTGWGEWASHSVTHPALAESRAGENGGSPGQLVVGPSRVQRLQKGPGP